jgi:potassium-transporting ATPase KdpC subunit
MKKLLKAVLIFIALTIITGIFYPLTVTFIAKVLFPCQAAGSIIGKDDGTAIGSVLIGQSFTEAKYFWPRPSATGDFQYNSLASTGSNLGPTNKDLISQLADRVAVLRKTGLTSPIPADSVSASASGLDPHISLDFALAQIPRIAKVRNISENRILSLVTSQIENRTLAFIGAKRINVLKLNLSLDKL